MGVDACHQLWAKVVGTSLCGIGEDLSHGFGAEEALFLGAVSTVEAVFIIVASVVVRHF